MFWDQRGKTSMMGGSQLTTLQLARWHRRRCDRQQCHAGSIYLCFYLSLSGSPVTTVNRAVGIQERLEGGQGRLADGRKVCTRSGWARYPLHTTIKSALTTWTPKLTTSTIQRKQPGGPPRGGMEDGPNRTDNTEPTGTTTTKEQKILRKCGCGWAKVRQGGLRAWLSTTDGERVEPHQLSQQEVHHQQQKHNPLHEPTRGATPKEKPIHKAKVRGPKASDKEAWRCFEQSVHPILQNLLAGSTTVKLNLFGNIIYEEGKERFGEMHQKKNTPKQKGRRETETFKLVKERRLLRKAWRKSEEHEKEDLKALWDQLKARLANLRRAERIRKRRSRKEKARASFFRDPFKYARGLLKEKKSGKLETTAEELQNHIKEQLGDSSRNIPLGSPRHVPRPPEVASQFDTSPPKWTEIKQVIENQYRDRTAYPIRAITTFTPKEKDSRNITQFRGIALLDVEGKIFFAVVARRMTSYFLSNNYIDTSCQKAGVPGFPGCVEHFAMIWEQIQTAKREKSDLHVVWLDLANVYGSVPHQLITFALNFFHIPTSIQSLISTYFSNFHVCYTTQEITTGWQQLEKVLAMGCSISPILFTAAFEIVLITAAFEIILIGGKQMVRGVRNQSGQCLPALRSYMDDVTTLLQTAAYTNRLLKRLEELLIWVRMKIKPAKSRSLSIQKGARSDNISFSVDGEKIPLLVEQPVQSLGRLYTADLSDKHMTSSIITQLSEGLGKLDRSHLPGKFKIWCYQFTLYQRQDKVRLVFELRDSSDPFVQKAKAPVRTGRKWRAEQAVDQAISQLKHQEIVGWLQPGRSGLRWGPAPKLWSKASKRKRKELVVLEVIRMEDEMYKIRAVSQCQQGRWTNWESVTKRAIVWADVEDSTSEAELPHKNPSLQHILTGCKSALTRYRWRHNQVLQKLAEVLEACRLEVNKTSLSTSQLRIHFVRQGAEAQNINQKEWSVLTPGWSRQKKALRKFAEEAEQGSFWLWLRRRRPYRCPTTWRCSGIKGAKHL
ncbi:hypothetical protein SKAU_G00059570 [Synaphobranchus kaupii]|uniref:Reverse transcriptase domain-containing protein n=1 Tax=Synaphobranchus kaupii TaxID=118154 RepID=A0A9Q1JAM0_SYNKA|nr:hypothetical protein SKAU_G00059570 [Synaphobranchus kaupii]